ncbi:MAG: CARDB domain-containing protein, partial [Solirubrobacteraceae bacterium]
MAAATRRWAGMLVGAAAVALLAAPAHAKPDLVVSKLSNPPASLRAGDELRLKVTVRNKGRRTAKRSAVGFYLSTGKRRSRDAQALTGRLNAKKLKRRKKASGSAQLTVPPDADPGSYRVIACADDRRKVRERNERNNCRASRSNVRIEPSGPAFGPLTPASPAPPVAGPSG